MAYHLCTFVNVKYQCCSGSFPKKAKNIWNFGEMLKTVQWELLLSQVTHRAATDIVHIMCVHVFGMKWKKVISG